MPNFPKSCNSYNQVTVKWHPRAKQFRIRVETRGLSTFNSDGTEELPTRWLWETLQIDDRSFIVGDSKPPPIAVNYRKFQQALDEPLESERIAKYERSRGNLPVVEVMPSLVAGQAYEVRAWIAHHGKSEAETDLPTEVTWTAGKKFPVATVSRKDDPLFCAIFNYWGPMLLQAQLRFSDGHTDFVSAYARMPIDYKDRGAP